jgi:hypothetical protein
MTSTNKQQQKPVSSNPSTTWKQMLKLIQ